MIFLLCFFFFFSSRRRHTRWTGDWSSDVCSSDLLLHAPSELLPAGRLEQPDSLLPVQQLLDCRADRMLALPSRIDANAALARQYTLRVEHLHSVVREQLDKGLQAVDANVIVIDLIELISLEHVEEVLALAHHHAVLVKEAAYTAHDLSQGCHACEDVGERHGFRLACPPHDVF